MTYDIIPDSYAKKAYLFKKKYPKEAEILKSFSEKLDTCNDNEIEEVINKTMKKLNLENEIELEKLFIKYWGEDPQDIKDFEKEHDIKY